MNIKEWMTPDRIRTYAPHGLAGLFALLFLLALFGAFHSKEKPKPVPQAGMSAETVILAVRADALAIADAIKTIVLSGDPDMVAPYAAGIQNASRRVDKNLETLLRAFEAGKDARGMDRLAELNKAWTDFSKTVLDIQDMASLAPQGSPLRSVADAREHLRKLEKVLDSVVDKAPKDKAADTSKTAYLVLRSLADAVTLPPLHLVETADQRKADIEKAYRTNRDNAKKHLNHLIDVAPKEQKDAAQSALNALADMDKALAQAFAASRQDTREKAKELAAVRLTQTLNRVIEATSALER